MQCTYGHTAIYVDDISWYTLFFERVFSMQVVRREEGQVWLDGGLQFIEAPAAERGMLAHICVLVPDVEQFRARMLYNGGRDYPPDANMVELPNGLLVELKPLV